MQFAHACIQVLLEAQQGALNYKGMGIGVMGKFYCYAVVNFCFEC